MNTTQISIVIPLFNEEESIHELNEWIRKVMTEHAFSYEILFIDDGSNDGSWDVIEEMSKRDHSVKGIKFQRNYGKSAALNTGFQIAKGDVIITMDADLQDNPEEIPALYQMIVDEKYDLVSGWKKKRYDPITKTLPTKLFNAATRWMSGIHLHDFNCGLKAYTKKLVKSIEVYGEMHRYVPVIAKRSGFSNIGEKVVQHQERKYGQTKFGVERFFNGFLDLISIYFMTKFSRRPMHIFGLLGSLMFFVGFGITLFLGIQKVYYLSHQMRLRLITDDPLFYIALVTMILGTQLFLAGFLGELISRSASDRNKYLIDETLNIE